MHESGASIRVSLGPSTTRERHRSSSRPWSGSWIGPDRGAAVAVRGTRDRHLQRLLEAVQLRRREAGGASIGRLRCPHCSTMISVACGPWRPDDRLDQDANLCPRAASAAWDLSMRRQRLSLAVLQARTAAHLHGRQAAMTLAAAKRHRSQ